MQDKITVKKSGLFNKYKTIQKAVDDILPGGIIYVESGEYLENVVINAKDVSIIAKGNVVIKESQTKAIVTINTCQVTLKGIYLIQENPSNALHISSQANVNLQNCYLEGYKTKNVQKMFPVIWVSTQSVLSLKDSTVIGHASETIYSNSSTIKLDACEFKGYGISIDDKSKLKGSHLKINYPYSFGINCMKSELEIDGIEAVGGGVAMIIDQSRAKIENLTALHQYRDAVRIIQSEVYITNARIEDFMEIKKKDSENYMSGIDVCKQSDVTLSKILLKNSLSGAIGVKDSTITIREAEISDVHIAVISNHSTCHFLHSSISHIACNGVSLRNSPDSKVISCYFEHCGKIEKQIYPSIFVSESDRLEVKDSQVRHTRGDGLYVTQSKEIVLDGFEVDHTNIGINGQIAEMHMHEVRVSHCDNQAVNVKSVNLTIDELKMKDNVMNRKNIQHDNPKHKRLAKMPSFIAEHSTLKAKLVDAQDTVTSLGFFASSLVEIDQLINAGDIIINQSDVFVHSFTYQEGNIHPTNLHISNKGLGAIDFENPSTKILLVQDQSSHFRSNLKYNPKKLVQVDFTDKSKTNHKEETKELGKVSAEEAFKREISGPKNYIDSLVRWFNQYSLYKIRQKQAIDIHHDAAMIWLQKSTYTLKKYFDQFVCGLIEADMFELNQVYKLSGLTKDEITNVETGIIWLDDFQTLQQDQSLRQIIIERLQDKKKELIFILPLNKEQNETLQSVDHDFYRLFNLQITFDAYRLEDIANLTCDKLSTHQFTFDRDMVMQEMLNSEIQTFEGDWTEQLVSTIIQVQSNRLLENSISQLDKTYLSEIIKEDVLQALEQLKE